MFRLKRSNSIAALAGIFLIFGHLEAREQLWSGQQPPPMRKRSNLEKILGPAEAVMPLTRNLNICFVWGYDNFTRDPIKRIHPAGTHEFRKVKDLVLGLLSTVPGVKTDSAFYFPSKKQWDSADIVIWYLQPDNFVDSNYAYIDKFQARGGGMIVLHDATILNFKMIANPTVDKWANRIGLAYKFNGTNTSLYGPLPMPQKVNLASKHPILERFQDTTDFQDELYWKLVPASDTSTGLTVLITSQAGAEKDAPPLPSNQMPAEQWPFMWAYEKGPGKVFVNSLLHNFWTINDPLFRILLFRAIAWEAGEAFAPFRSLVTAGIDVVEDATALSPKQMIGKSKHTVSGLKHAGKPHRINGSRIPAKNQSK